MIATLGSSLSHILAIAVTAFVAVASAILLWDGLAASLGRGGGQPLAGRERRRARVRALIGAIGFAAALWVALGMLTRAW